MKEGNSTYFVILVSEHKQVSSYFIDIQKLRSWLDHMQPIFIQITSWDIWYEHLAIT